MLDLNERNLKIYKCELKMKIFITKFSEISLKKIF